MHPTTGDAVEVLYHRFWGLRGHIVSGPGEQFLFRVRMGEVPDRIVPHLGLGRCLFLTRREFRLLPSAGGSVSVPEQKISRLQRLNFTDYVVPFSEADYDKLLNKSKRTNPCT